MKIGDVKLYRLDDRQVIITHINHKSVSDVIICSKLKEQMDTAGITVRYSNYAGDYKTMMVHENELYDGKKEV